MTGSVEHRCDRCGQYESLCPCDPPNGPLPAITVWLSVCAALTALTALVLHFIPI